MSTNNNNEYTWSEKNKNKNKNNTYESKIKNGSQLGGSQGVWSSDKDKDIDIDINIDRYLDMYITWLFIEITK